MDKIKKEKVFGPLMTQKTKSKLSLELDKADEARWEKRRNDKRGSVSGAKNNNSRESRAKRAEAAKTLNTGGADHVVKKNKKGEIIVDHAASAKAGKYDKINLTKKAGAKTVKEGVKATKDWHKKNPHKKGK
jgi:hypothetical protein